MKKTIIYCIVTAFVLAWLSFWYIEYIYDLFFYFFRNGNMEFNLTRISGGIDSSLKTSISIGLVPILLLIVWKLGNIGSTRKRLLSIVIVIICIVGSFLLNILRIKDHGTVITNMPTVIINFPFEEILLEYAILAGTVFGCIISFFILHRRK